MARGKSKQKEEQTSDESRSKVEVFTSPTCPHCPAAVKLAKEVEEERKDIKVVETSTGTQAGYKRAEQYNIMGVPAILVSGPKHKDTIAFRGPPLKKELNHAIDISLGLARMPEKKQGFLSKIFG